MSEYDKFFGNPVDVEIAGVKCQMKPLTINDLGMLSKLQRDETRTKAIKDILIKTMIPKITEEQVNNIKLECFQGIMETVMKVNGLDTKASEPKKPEV